MGSVNSSTHLSQNLRLESLLIFFSPCFFLWFWVLLTSPDVGIEEDFKNVDCIVESSPSE